MIITTLCHFEDIDMPLLCIEKRRSPTELDEADDGGDDGVVSPDVSIWQDVPDSILLHIFSFLNVADLGYVAQTCKTWNRVSLDESLWKDLFHSALHVTCGQLAPGKRSWCWEVKRVHYHVPTVLTETLTEHTDEVLHVSFSHNGKLFSTTSKDATLKIWEVGYPTVLKYSKDFRELLGWDFTQFSSFNESNTMVLVSSVKSTHLMDRRGYMAILSLIHDFEILRVVTMDPSQLFGAWLDDTTFLGGSLEISLDRFATTVQIEAHEVTEIFSPLPSPPPSPVVEESSGRPLFTFSSETASLIKFLTVANLMKEDLGCHSNLTSPCLEDLSMHDHETNVADADTDMNVDLSSEKLARSIDVTEYMNSDPRTSDTKAQLELFDSNKGLNCDIEQISHQDQMEHCLEDAEQNMDSEQEITETLNTDIAENKICRNCLKLVNSKTKILPNTAVCECVSELHESKGYSQRPSDLDLDGCCSKSSDNGGTAVKKKKQFQKNLILVTGEFAVALHQIGFKNVPPYTKESVLASGVTPMDADNPEAFMVVNYSNNDIHYVRRQQKPDTPDHLLDLFGHVTGLCLTPDQSGSEDAKGYLWDRHFQSVLTTYEHDSGVVNAVGFCPSNQEYLVTVSDDKTIKVWRSKSEVKRLDIKTDSRQEAEAT